MIEIATLVTAFTTLFVIVDPIGLAPLFVAMTAGMTHAQRRGVAFRALATSAALMLLLGATLFCKKTRADVRKGKFTSVDATSPDVEMQATSPATTQELHSEEVAGTGTQNLDL